MPHPPANHTMNGWEGNSDIYGIGKADSHTVFTGIEIRCLLIMWKGIRIGYYTQSAAIWVANFFAPHEAPYIHTVTLLFLIAILVGVCSLARDEKTYVVEPFILMTVAYNVCLLSCLFIGLDISSHYFQSLVSGPL